MRVNPDPQAVKKIMDAMVEETQGLVDEEGTDIVQLQINPDQGTMYICLAGEGVGQEFYHFSFTVGIPPELATFSRHRNVGGNYGKLGPHATD